MLSPPTVTAKATTRACNALALLQCVASHNDTKNKLVSCKCVTATVFLLLRDVNSPPLPRSTAQIPLYLFPFLNTVSRPFDNLRLTSLGVIGALVKVSDLLHCSVSLIIGLTCTLDSWYRNRQLSVANRNNTPLFANHGNRVGYFQNSSYVYCGKDLAG
jgi:hypothetical protein